MRIEQDKAFSIREAHREEFGEIGRLVVDAYAALSGMPTLDEQPEYYGRLFDVSQRVANPAIRVFVAIGPSGVILGSVDFIDEMRHYGSGGTAGEVPDAAGIRLLAVNPMHRGRGVGKGLTRFCVERAQSLGKARVVLHTTRAMETAWGMYEKMGFKRHSDLDFSQGKLDVFGFELDLGKASEKESCLSVSCA